MNGGEGQLPDALLGDLAHQARALPHFGFAIAAAARDLVKAGVRELYPLHERSWPLLGAGVAWDVRLVVPDNYLVVVLRDHPSADCGNGQVTFVPAAGLETVAGESGEEWLDRIRARVGASVRDGFFILPLLVASEDAGAILRAWQEMCWDRVCGQVAHNLALHAGELGLPSPEEAASSRGRRPPLNDTDLAIAELVFAKGPLTAKQIEASLPPGHRTTEDNVRRIFSEKLVPHYGFRNPRNRRGYVAPPNRTWP